MDKLQFVIPLKNRTSVDSDTRAQIHDLFQYHAWDDGMINQGSIVLNALEEAYAAIIANVPPSPTRTRALNAIVDARMLANAAITHKGKY
jgi:hypothetical protein